MEVGEGTVSIANPFLRCEKDSDSMLSYGNVFDDHAVC